MASLRLRLKGEPWPHPDDLTAFHDEIQRLWGEGFQNLLENTVLPVYLPLLCKEGQGEVESRGEGGGEGEITSSPW